MERWRIRNGILSLLSRIPAGENLYQIMQKYFGQFNNENFIRNKIREISEFIAVGLRNGALIEGANIVELGTGWVPLAPILFSLYGAEKVISIDIHSYYIHSLLVKTTRILIDELNNISPAQVSADKYDLLKNNYDKPAHLLESMNIRMFSPLDARKTRFPDNMFDLYYSIDTLEHIPLEDLKSIFQESIRIVKPGGIFLHSIDLADHFSYTDKDISSINFLCYSSQEWTRLCNEYAYHNRLRKNEYETIIHNSNLKIIGIIEEIDQRALDDLKNGFQVHDDYVGEKHEELCGNRLTYLLTSAIC